MKTLLIPVDFSAATENAIEFAAEWSSKYDYERIILLKSFYTSMYENVIMSGEFANVDQDYLNKNRGREKEKLDSLCRHLNNITPENIKVQTALSELPLIRSVVEIVKQEEPAMILVGSDPANYDNSAFIAGNVISIAKISPVRVMIIPSNYRYQEIKQVLVPCDLNAIHSVNKINILRSTPQWKNVKLLVLNVDMNERHLKPDEKFTQAENNLHHYLKNFDHEIYYVANKNVISGILNFKKIREVQLLIALPGSYSFLASLTHRSVSQALYRNSKLPVLILK